MLSVLAIARRHDMVKAECPACNTNVNLGGKPKMGQRLKCNSCGTELEVVWLDPVELDWPYDDDDFDDYDDDD
jgi:lysine biosynthesis protein LysW